MVNILLFLLLQQNSTVTFSYEAIPGYAEFTTTMDQISLGEDPYLLIHESCSPEFVARLFHLAAAFTPTQRKLKLQKIAEEQYVGKMLRDEFGVSLLYLREDATDRLLYRKMKPYDQTQSIIIFSCPDKLKSLKHIPTKDGIMWTSITLVLQLDEGNIIFGEVK